MKRLGDFNRFMIDYPTFVKCTSCIDLDPRWDTRCMIERENFHCAIDVYFFNHFTLTRFNVTFFNNEFGITK